MKQGQKIISGVAAVCFGGLVAGTSTEAKAQVTGGLSVGGTTIGLGGAGTSGVSCMNEFIFGLVRLPDEDCNNKAVAAQTGQILVQSKNRVDRIAGGLMIGHASPAAAEGFRRAVNDPAAAAAAAAYIPKPERKKAPARKVSAAHKPAMKACVNIVKKDDNTFECSFK